ncbi:BTB/POZ domain-containing protein [Megavirus baoshan]|uniref:BTB/POZ domain-containing protein n=1 Tax=Megavirus baoshan TaxID=2496520 RepID=A0A3Q8U838_9VIRU|nr:BTB/POZ domain-containing protein [Megavirus baoshan]AZL89564.1 BTB/POZ domain-containing protein [Megavirus baoshan]
MDYNKAYDLVKNNRFCDLKLTIDDGTNKFIINVHKIILYSSCIYFEKLLIFGENYSNDIKIVVPNAYVTRDIIMKFYGQKINSGNYPEWKIYLESYRCYDFLGLEFDISDIRHLIVPEEGFELLLDVIELIGYNDETIKLLIKNLPENYDLKNLSKELLTEMIELSRNHYYIAKQYGVFYVYDLITHDVIKSIPTNVFSKKTKYSYGDLDISPDNNQIAYVSKGYNIVILSIDTAQILHVIKNNYYSTKLSYSPDSKKLAFNKSNEIFIIDTEYGSIINTFKTYQEISRMHYLNNDTILIVHEFSTNLSKVSRIKIYDTKTGNFIKNLIDCRYKINKLLCTEKYLVIVGCDYKIRLYNIETNNLNILEGHTNFISSICLNHNVTKLASSSYDGTIIIWDIKTGEKINIIQNIYNDNNDDNDDYDDNHNYYHHYNDDNDDNDDNDNNNDNNDNDDNDNNDNNDDNDDNDNNDNNDNNYDDNNDDNNDDDNDDNDNNDDNDDNDNDNDDNDDNDNDNDNNNNDDNYDDNDNNDNNDDDNDNNNNDDNYDDNNKLYCIFKNNMIIVDNIYYDNNINSDDNGYYHYIIDTLYDNNKYPRCVYWTDYKDQLMVKYNNCNVVMIEYNTGIVILKKKYHDPPMYYFYRDNEKFVHKIKKII